MAQEQFDSAKDKIKIILAEIARKDKGTITYTGICGCIEDIVDLKPTQLDDLLCAVSAETEKDGGGLLSVLVIHGGRDSDKLPGSRFFKIAKDAGRDVSDRKIFWQKEKDFVCQYWQKH